METPLPRPFLVMFPLCSVPALLYWPARDAVLQVWSSRVCPEELATCSVHSVPLVARSYLLATRAFPRGAGASSGTGHLFCLQSHGDLVLHAHGGKSRAASLEHLTADLFMLCLLGETISVRKEICLCNSGREHERKSFLLQNFQNCW